jgi:hypothetical protein
MRVPTTPVDGLFLKFFVLKIDGSDEAALKAMITYALVKENPALTKDIAKHLRAIGKPTLVAHLLRMEKLLGLRKRPEREINEAGNQA